MKNKWLYSLLGLLSVCVCLFTAGLSVQAAESTGSVTISKLRNIGEGKTEPVSGSYYALAQLGDSDGLVDASGHVLDKDAVDKKLATLASLSLTDLQKQTPDKTLHYSEATDAEGAVTVKDLVAGVYYIVEVTRANDGKWQRSEASVPSLILVEAGRTSTIGIKNHDVPKADTVSVKVRKVWVGKELNSVVIYLLQNGQKFAEVELNESNQWMYTFTNLPKTDENGKDYVYTVQEEVPADYVSTIEKGEDGFVVTNTEATPPPPTTPKRRIIIKTGSLTIYWIVGIAAVLIGFGYKMYKTEKK